MVGVEKPGAAGCFGVHVVAQRSTAGENGVDLRMKVDGRRPLFFESVENKLQVEGGVGRLALQRNLKIIELYGREDKPPLQQFLQRHAGDKPLGMEQRVALVVVQAEVGKLDFVEREYMAGTDGESGAEQAR